MKIKGLDKLFEAIGKIPIDKLIELIVRTAVDQAIKSAAEEFRGKV